MKVYLHYTNNSQHRYLHNEQTIFRQWLVQRSDPPPSGAKESIRGQKSLVFSSWTEVVTLSPKLFALVLMESTLPRRKGTHFGPVPTNGDVAVSIFIVVTNINSRRQTICWTTLRRRAHSYRANRMFGSNAVALAAFSTCLVVRRICKRIPINNVFPNGIASQPMRTLHTIGIDSAFRLASVFHQNLFHLSIIQIIQFSDSRLRSLDEVDQHVRWFMPGNHLMLRKWTG